MKFATLATAIFLLGFTPAALAHHDHRGGYFGAQQKWARHYAETAIRQVRKNRRQHCNYYGQRWSPSYYDHYHWALRVHPGRARSEIERRDRDLRHCWQRQGRYYGYRGYDDRYQGHGSYRHGHQYRNHYPRYRRDSHAHRDGHRHDRRDRHGGHDYRDRDDGRRDRQRRGG